MFGSFLQPQFIPCPSCGASVPTADLELHECSRERWLDYQMFQLRAELASFDVQVAAFLASPRGRFEAYYAERDRLLAPA